MINAPALARLKARYGDLGDRTSSHEEAVREWRLAASVVRGHAVVGWLWETLDIRDNRRPKFHALRAEHRASQRNLHAQMAWGVTRERQKALLKNDWGVALNLALNQPELQRSVQRVVQLLVVRAVEHPAG